MVTSDWAQDSWNTSVSSPPTNQKKATHPAVLPPNFAYKNSSLKTMRVFGFFEHWAIHSPCSKLFSAPNSAILVCLASLCVEHKLGFYNILSAQIVVLKCRFPPKESRQMAISRFGVGNVGGASGTFCPTGDLRSCQTPPGPCHKHSGASLKRLLLAKGVKIWALKRTVIIIIWNPSNKFESVTS